MSLKVDNYITQVNEGKISIVDALFELTAKELEVKNFNATNAMVKVAGFPHLKEMKDFDFEFEEDSVLQAKLAGKISSYKKNNGKAKKFLKDNSNADITNKFSKRKVGF